MKQILGSWKVWTVILVVLFVIAIVLRIITPPEKEQPFLSSSLKPTIETELEAPTALSSVLFEGETPKLPTSFILYQATQEAEKPIEFAQRLAQQLNLPPAPEEHLENLWRDQKTGVTLDFQDYAQRVVYLNTSSSRPSQVFAPKIETTQAITKAEEFLQKILGENNLTPDLENIKYKNEEIVFDEENQDASLIIIPFKATIDDFPLYYQSAVDTWAELDLNASYDIEKAEIFILPPPFSPGQRVTALTLDAALESIHLGKGQFISITHPTLDFETTNVQELIFSEVQTEYRFDPTSSIYYPYYRFSGTGTVNEVPGNFIVILPAVPIR